MFNKIRGKYSKRKTKKLNRDVISYEEVPLEDYEQESTRVSAVDAKKVVKLVIILVILGLIVFAFANRESLTPDNISNWFKYDVLGQGDGEGFPMDIVGTNIESGNIITAGNSVSYASDTSFVTLSSNASVIQNYQLSYASPVISSSGNNVLVYGLDGKEYHTGTTNKLDYTGKTDEGIITGDISSSGVYGVVTKANGYFSKLFVYNKDHEQIYAYSFSDYYISSLAINSAGNRCVACGVSGKDGALSGVAYVLDFQKEEPLGIYDLGENFIYHAEYLTGGEVCLIGDTASAVLDTVSGQVKQNSYNQMTLASFEVNEDTATFAVALSRTGDGYSCTLQNFRSNGELNYEVETDYRVEAMTIFKGNTYILENDTIHCFDFNRNEISKADAGSGAKQIKVCSDGSVYVLGVNEIRKIAL